MSASTLTSTLSSLISVAAAGLGMIFGAGVAFTTGSLVPILVVGGTLFVAGIVATVSALYLGLAHK